MNYYMDNKTIPWHRDECVIAGGMALGYVLTHEAGQTCCAVLLPGGDSEALTDLAARVSVTLPLRWRGLGKHWPAPAL